MNVLKLLLALIVCSFGLIGAHAFGEIIERGTQNTWAGLIAAGVSAAFVVVKTMELFGWR